jgi:MscS family membrane protein
MQEHKVGVCSNAERKISVDLPSLRVAHFFRHRRFYTCLLSLILLFPVLVVAQLVASAPPAPPPSEPLKEALGRTTPRGTVLGFLSAAHKGNYQIAALYLDTRLRDKSAAILAHQLFVVLDRRLPARLNELSDRPEGSLSNLLRPDQDVIGTVASVNGNVEILLDRVDIGKGELRWLFSTTTLESIPRLYEEVNVVSVDNVLPEAMVNTRFAGIPLFEWIAVLVGMPLLYALTAFASRLASPIAGTLRRQLRKRPDLPNPDVVPRPFRLLFVAFVILWTISKVSLPLLARQFWSSTATVIIIAACVWLFILLNGRVEGLLRHRLARRHTGIASILRLGRRVTDLLAVFVGMLVGFNHFGVNPTAALAGLGVGGIAVALAAQKTLENVIGGASIIFDQAVRVGETLKFAEMQGKVEDIGLRSTRIRTMDRTVVSVPNGLIANASLENISIRDKFWFHPNLSLRWETTASQMRSVLEALNNLLAQQPNIERDSIRVRFLRFGASSLDVEVFAYFFAHDWSHFLEIQQELLLQIMEIVQAAGTQMALQSHVVYPAAVSALDGTHAQVSLKTAVSDGKPIDHPATPQSA